MTTLKPTKLKTRKDGTTFRIPGLSVVVNVYPPSESSSDGDIGGTTIIDNSRTEEYNYWIDNYIKILEGPNIGEIRKIVNWNNINYTFTVSPPFPHGQVKKDVSYEILLPRAIGYEPALETDLQLILSAATAVVQGTPFNLEHDFDTHTWTIILTGAPATLQVDLEGSIDGTNWFPLDSYTGLITAMRHVVNKAIRQIRANLITLTGVNPTVTVATIHMKG